MYYLEYYDPLHDDEVVRNAERISGIERTRPYETLTRNDEAVIVTGRNGPFGEANEIAKTIGAIATLAAIALAVRALYRIVS